MNYKELGNSGMNVSVIGFGCWAAGNDWTGTNDEKSIRAMREAIKCGINFFDVAPVYGFGHAEKVLGKALGQQRKDVFIATKCGLRWDDEKNIKRNLTRESILEEIEISLSRLNTDYVDLYQIHWPDPNTPLKETMTTLAELKEQGKIRNIGVSNFSIPLLEEASKYVEVVSNQVLFNMIERNADSYHGLPLTYRTESEILPYCEENNIGVIPYSPLCQGLLTDGFSMEKVERGDMRCANPQLRGKKLKNNLKFAEELSNIAARSKKPMVQLVMHWLISQKAITTIIASSISEKEVRENVATLDWTPDTELLAEVDQLIKRCCE